MLKNKTFEEITNQELVGNLAPDDLLVHARHNYLMAAKDLLKEPYYEGDRLIGEACLLAALKVQEALEVIWESNY